MVHFNNKTVELMDLSKEEKIDFLKTVDLENTDFEVKIADFGLSARCASRSEKLSIFCGTLLYMGPQIFFGQKYTYKCDLWSIGVMFFLMLNKVVPFNADTK